MAFLILGTTLYSFSIVADSARKLSAEAELKDVANRVSLGVQESLFIASQRQDSMTKANTSLMRYERELSIPSTVQGWRYRINLTSSFINGTVVNPAITVSVPTFNAAVVLPPGGPGACTISYVVCELSGDVSSQNGRILIAYLYNRIPNPDQNEIKIS